MNDCGSVGREQKRLQQQPFGDKAVERRQPGDRQRADQRRPCDPWHAMDQSAELAEAPLAGRMQDRPGGEEQQAFEKRVIERVVERRHQRDRRQKDFAIGLEQDREPDSGEDDADVLDRRVREQALHVHLHGRVDDAEQRRQQAEHQRGDAPPPELDMEQVERHPQETVDRCLQHDGGQQRGDRRGCRRMRFRQPDVQRQEPRLGTESGQREQKSNRRPSRPARTIERIEPNV